MKPTVSNRTLHFVCPWSLKTLPKKKCGFCIINTRMKKNWKQILLDNIISDKFCAYRRLILIQVSSAQGHKNRATSEIELITLAIVYFKPLLSGKWPFTYTEDPKNVATLHKLRISSCFLCHLKRWHFLPNYLGQEVIIIYIIYSPTNVLIKYCFVNLMA